MEFLSNIPALPFYMLAITAVVCSLGMIFNKNLVRAGYLLIGCFAAIAGFYFMLSANFVAISQILIYAVGIVLVIVFAVMLTSLKDAADELPNDEDLDSLKPRRIMAFVISLLMFALFTFIIQSQDWSLISKALGGSYYEPFISEFASQYTARIGDEMMSIYIIPFELISVLLLVVLVGVIILGKKKID